MNKLIIFLALFLFMSAITFAQTSDKPKGGTATLKTTTSKGFPVNDIQAFAKLFDPWDVGNLHFYSHPEDKPVSDYYFKGVKVEPMFQQYFPYKMRKSVLYKDKAPYAVAAVRGAQLSEYYILRINDNGNANMLVLFELINDKLSLKKKVSLFKKEG